MDERDGAAREAFAAAAGGATAPGGEVSAQALAGLARWAAVLAASGDGVAVVGGLRNAPSGVVEVRGPERVVVLLSAAASVVAVGDEVAGRWSADRAVAAAVIDVLDVPAGSAAVVADALASAPAADGLDPGPVLAAVEAALHVDRRVLAARLHDGPIQELTAAQLLLDSALWSLPDLDGHQRDPLDQAVAALRAAITSSRALMAELSGGGPRA